MMVKPSLTWLMAIASAVSGFTLEDAGNAKEFKSPTVPGRFIIEYEGGSRFVKRDSLSVQSTLSEVGVDASVNSQYDSSIFQGASIQVVNANDTTIDDLKNIAGVKDAWQASYITLDDQIEAADTSVWNPHSITGVDTLHERGIKGDGVTIAIIDTGIDYTHPALGGGIGEGFSIIGGYDFSDDPENPTNDPMDCAGHGTFVSSVIIGNSDKIVGVAPDAKIKMYKVFGCADTTSDDIVMAGLLKAYEDRPDVISLSLGADRGYNTVPIAVVSSRIAQDITIMYAAGNSGEGGPFLASDGGSGKDVLAIGSTHATQMLGYKAVAVSSGGETKEFGYLGNVGDPFSVEGTFKVRASNKNACTGPDNADEDHTLLIARRGTCYMGSLYNELEANGWNSVLLYPNSESESIAYISQPILDDNNLKNVGVISWEFAQWALSEVAAGNSVEVTVNDDYGIYVFDNVHINAGQMDYYSSWGPTFQNDFYPSVSAPGGAVFGAAIGGGYSVGSGTSFACPYVAGVAALYFATNPSATPEDFRHIIMSTASDLALYQDLVTEYSQDISTIDYSKIAPAIQQGAGLIDTVKMLDQRTKIISQPYLELNDTVNRVEDFEITIRNDNAGSIDYELSHIPATTIETRDEYLTVEPYFPPFNSAEAAVTFSQASFTLGAGESITINVNIKIPEDTDISLGAVFSGKVNVNGANGDSVSVPYMGVQANTYEWSALQNKPLIIGYDTASGYYYNLTEKVFLHDFIPSEYDSPRIMFNYVYGTEFQSFDIVDEDYDLSTYSYPPVAGENGFAGPIKSQPDVFGNTMSWPNVFISRFTPAAEIGFQSFGNGTLIPAGRYRILSRAVRMFGDVSNHDDWVLYLSDPFSVGDVDGSQSSNSDSASASETSITSSESTGISESSTVSSTISTRSEAPSSTVPSGEYPTATGLDVISDIKIVNKNSQGSAAFKNDWFDFSVSFSSKDPIPDGTVTQFIIAGFETNPDVFYTLSTVAGSTAASIEIEGSVFTLTWEGFASWNQNIEGTMYFDGRLTGEVIESITAPGSIEFIAFSPEKEFSNIFDFGAQPTDAPYRNSYLTSEEEEPVWVLDVPGTLGPWDSVRIVSEASTFDYSFYCDRIAKSIGSNLDAFRNATEFRDAADWSSESCVAANFDYTYSETVAEDEVLRVFVPAEKQSSFSNDFLNVFTVTVTKDGEESVFTLNERLKLYPSTSLYAITGERYVPPIEEESSSVSSEPSSTGSSTESSSAAESLSTVSSTESLSTVSSTESLSTVSSATESLSTVSSTESSSTTASSTVSTSEPSSSSSIGPSITGTIVDGNPQWELSLPGELGPWSSVDFSASAEGGFTFNDIKYVIDGKSYAVNSTMVRDVDFNTQLYSEDGLTAHFGGRYISGDSFTINITIAITRPDQPESLSKRDVLVFELSNTISLNSESSSESTVESTSESTVESTSESTVESTSESTVESTSESTIESTTVLTTGSTGASTTQSSTGSSSTSTNASNGQTNNSSSGSITSIASTSTATEQENGTTVITVTSCEEDKCSETAVTTGLTVVTTTIHGVVTEYTTYCPLTTSTMTEGPQTTVVTVTSCSENKCTEMIVTSSIHKGTDTTTLKPATTDATETQSKVIHATGLDSSALSIISKATNALPNTSITVTNVGTTTRASGATSTSTHKVTSTVTSKSSAASTTVQSISTFEGAAPFNGAQSLIALVLPFFFLF